MNRSSAVLLAILLLPGISPAAYYKNVGSKVYFHAWDTTADAPKTGDAANLTAYVSIDGAAEAALTDTSATEIDATNSPGSYVFDTTNGEMNGSVLHFTCKSSTGANVTFVPVTIAPTDMTAAAMANMLAFFDGTGYVGGTAKLTVDVSKWLNTTVATPTTAGVPAVDVTYFGGTANATATIANAFGGSTFQAAADVKTAIEAAGSSIASILEDTGTTLPGTLTTIGGYVDTEVASILEDTGTTLPGTLSTISGYVDTEVASILADTGTDGVVVGGVLAAAIKDFFDTDSTTTYASAVDGSVVKEIVDNAGGSALTEAGIADAVWGEDLSTYSTPDTAGYIMDNTATSTDLDDIITANALVVAIDGVTDKIDTMLQSDGSTGYEFTSQAVSNVSATVEGEVTVAAASVTAIQSGLATATALDAVDNYVDTEVAAIVNLLGTPAGVSVSADIAAVKSDSAAAKTAAEKIDTNTELRTLLVGSDTAVSSFAPATDKVYLGNGAHGGAAATLTMKQLAVTNSDAGGIAVNIQGTGTGNSHAINLASTNGKAIAAASTNSDAISIDSDAAMGVVVTGATGDIVGDITGAIASLVEKTGFALTAAYDAAKAAASNAQVVAALPTGFSTNTMTDGKLDVSASVSLTEQDKTDISTAIVNAVNASGVTLTTEEQAALVLAIVQALPVR